MVVQIVPEGVDEVNGVVSGVGVGVSWKQHWRKSDKSTLGSVLKLIFQNTNGSYFKL